MTFQNATTDPAPIVQTHEQWGTLHMEPITLCKVVFDSRGLWLVAQEEYPLLSQRTQVQFTAHGDS